MAKGFGKPSTIPTRSATKFMRAAMKCIEDAKGDEAKVHQFFKANVSKLDEYLLNALPQVFTKLTAQESLRTQQNIAELFANFGEFIREFPLGDRSLNLELSLLASQLSLKVFAHIAFSNNWALIQNNLGNAHAERIRGDRAENLENAIAAFELASQVYTREAFPQDWARAQNNLGIAYWERIRSDRAENLEKAIAAYDLALQIRTREAFPEDWARTQHNLANAYRERIKGEPIDNLEQAISTCQQAAQIFTRQAFPYKWAENQSNLADALMKRASLTQDFSDLDTAIALLQDALEVSVPGSPDFIDSQYRLGNALSRRYEHGQNSEDLDQAVRAYKTALDAISPEHYDRQKIWQALPTTQSILGSRLVREGQWQEGLQLLLNSVRQLSTGDDALAHANALFQTGRAHETLSDWENARLYYRDALRLYSHLKDEPGIAKSRAGLGGVLVSQGYLEKGLSELTKARESYHQLQRPERAADIDRLCQAAQRAQDRQATEVFA
ncbi:MAG TPA: tetratricopeptide repeat protein [Elainellaceae cyanobacterium]